MIVSLTKDRFPCVTWSISVGDLVEFDKSSGIHYNHRNYKLKAMTGTVGRNGPIQRARDR